MSLPSASRLTAAEADTQPATLTASLQLAGRASAAFTGAPS